jgi:sulfur relay (sulfurtransferase) complex TusBCD TusD component (DsrE family)
MANYLLVESRDPYQFTDAEAFYQIATDLAKAGNAVTVYLVQNGVLPARKGAKNGQVAILAATPSITVLADDFSLRERAISASNLESGVSVSTVDDLVDLLVQPGTKAVWH